MPTTAIINIKSLLQTEPGESRPFVAGIDMQSLPAIDDAYLIIENGIIDSFGPMNSFNPGRFDQTIDATGKYVLPAWCDSHTHIVYPASREIEYMDKIRGLSYEEIARRGGGILNTAARMQEASEEMLFDTAMARLAEMQNWGTGAVEIKSGYGLTPQSEIKMLRVIRRLKEKSPMTIKATFLGAHAVPAHYKGQQSKYVDEIIEKMLPQVADENLADYVDVFCDKGFFTVEDTDRILTAASRYGLTPKIHANELDYSGGIEAGVRHGARSVDHLEFTGKEQIEALKNSTTMPTILPGAAFFLNMRLAPVRDMIEAGLPVALASDFNPGSSPSGNMQLVMAMGSIMFRMLPNEVINAVTKNSAYAMGLENLCGSIAKGKKANIIITKPIPSVEYLTYAYGENKVETVIINK
jgi:imidazolonepropionase